VKKQSGFTLIELMMAIVIMGILATIALPFYQAYIYRAKAAEVLEMIGKVHEVMAEFHAESGIEGGKQYIRTNDTGDYALSSCVVFDSCKPVSSLKPADLEFPQLGMHIHVNSSSFNTQLPGQYGVILSVGDRFNQLNPDLKNTSAQVNLAVYHILRSEAYKSTLTRNGTVALYFQL